MRMRAMEAIGMPTKFAIALIATAGLLIALRGDRATGSQPGSSVEQGLERVDSALRQGLNRETHEKVEERLSGPVSDQFLSVVQASAAKLPD